MTKDDPDRTQRSTFRQSLGASDLAKNAVSILNQRQSYTVGGARQFVLDHLIRAILSGAGFDPVQMMEELKGHRLSPDAIIDIYVPAAAHVLGDKWQHDEVDFASVTVGSLRLQSLLSAAAIESPDFLRAADNVITMLIVVPLGEQHTLGAFVLAAQLRRLGVRVDVSYCETATDVVSRILTDPPNMVLFTASLRATLETVAHLVLDVRKVVTTPIFFALGGGFSEPDEVAKDISGVDLVTQQARNAVSFVASQRDTAPDRTGR